MSFPRRFREKNLIAVFKAHVETKDQSTRLPLLEGIELERLAWRGYIICVLEVFFFLKQKSASLWWETKNISEFGQRENYF